MAKYLGETAVEIEDSIFKGFGPKEWALFYIESYGQIDGEHHKTWVIDQVARLLIGEVPVIVLAKWDDGYEEYRQWLNEESEEYLKWLAEMKGEFVNGEFEYSYDKGIAP